MRYKKEGQSVKVIGNIWTNIRKHCIAQQSLLIKGITIKIMMQLITSQQYLGWEHTLFPANAQDKETNNQKAFPGFHLSI